MFRVKTLTVLAAVSGIIVVSTLVVSQNDVFADWIHLNWQPLEAHRAEEDSKPKPHDTSPVGEPDILPETENETLSNVGDGSICADYEEGEIPPAHLNCDNEQDDVVVRSPTEVSGPITVEFVHDPALLEKRSLLLRDD